ncbi:MAG: hypothetical protein HWD61_12770 [Parachlamydiaceae bacterium]|nr:MAG: hypothetical protein HWD61_12770 [Parachlamydiaceae bacterium]
MDWSAFCNLFECVSKAMPVFKQKLDHHHIVSLLRSFMDEDGISDTYKALIDLFADVMTSDQSLSFPDNFASCNQSYFQDPLVLLSLPLEVKKDVLTPLSKQPNFAGNLRLKSDIIPSFQKKIIFFRRRN